jgi:hypothetical protein
VPKRFVTIGSVLKFEAWQIDRTESKINCTARLMSLEDGAVHAEATALFYRPAQTLSFADAVQMFGRGSGMTKEQLMQLRTEKAARERAAGGAGKRMEAKL